MAIRADDKVCSVVAPVLADQHAVWVRGLDGRTGDDLDPSPTGGAMQDLDRLLAREAPSSSVGPGEVALLHDVATMVDHAVAKQTFAFGRQLLHQSSFLQHQKAVVVQKDPGADLAHGVRTLVHGHSPAALGQQHGHRQPGVAAPSDLRVLAACHNATR